MKRRWGVYDPETGGVWWLPLFGRPQNHGAAAMTDPRIEEAIEEIHAMQKRIVVRIENRAEVRHGFADLDVSKVVQAGFTLAAELERAHAVIEAARKCFFVKSPTEESDDNYELAQAIIAFDLQATETTT